MRIAAVAFLLVAQQVVFGQEAPTFEQLKNQFEAGAYQEVVDGASGMTDQAARYMAALSADRLGRPDEARRLYSELSGGDDDPWTWIGRSAAALVTEGSATPDAAAVEEGRSAAERARELLAANPDANEQVRMFADYQHGQVLTYQGEYAQAAEAFDRCIDVSPSFAYAHYYSGMSYREIRRIDLMAIRLDRFLELAPEAPERTRVQAIMRTVRG